MLAVYGAPPTALTASAIQVPVKEPDPEASDVAPAELTLVFANRVVTVEVCVPLWLMRLRILPFGAFMFIT